MVGDDRLHSFGRAQLLKLAMLARGVGAEAVDRNHGGHAELADIGEMAREIGKSLFERGDVFLAQCIERHAAVHL